MTVAGWLRALVGLAVAAGVAVTALPRHLPALGGLEDRTTQSLELVAFGLRALATALAAYVAVVLLALLLSGLRVLPARIRHAVERWTGRGLAAAVRRFVGASALAAGLLPMAPAAASASTAPVIEPVVPHQSATPPALAPAPPPPEAPPTTVTVRPGDSFWSIAEALAADELGRPPTDAEVAPRWTALVEHNRPRLADPTNPDLLFPGQVLDLPPP